MPAWLAGRMTSTGTSHSPAPGPGEHGPDHARAAPAAPAPAWSSRDGSITLHHGDNLAVMAGIPDMTVDAVVTDPPYNLSDSRQRDKDCLRRIVADFCLPDHHEGDVQGSQRGGLPAPALGGAPLGGVNRAVRVEAGVGVPEGAVDLQRAAVIEHEVDAGSEPAMLAPDGNLPPVGDAEATEGGGCYVLKLADGGHAPFCDVTCSCFTEPDDGVITVAVALPGAARGDRAGDDFSGPGRGDTDVRPGDHAGREAEGPAGVLAGGRAEALAVLRLDLRRGTGELRFADRAGERDPLFTLEAAQPVGAGAGARCLAAIPESARIRVVGGAADRAFTLHFPLHAFSSTGRPVGFMGMAWDGFDSPATFQRWCTAWARECMRVLKPGGHLLAFGSPRTWHRLAAGLEDAGLEVRDTIMWVGGQGFPKSLDISKAIDKELGAAPGGSGAAYVPATAAAAKWKGWGTALKPAWEPVIVARRPLAGTVAANVLQQGAGGLNIDACRVPVPGLRPTRIRTGLEPRRPSAGRTCYNAGLGDSAGEPAQTSQGRWPPNVVISHAPGCRPAGTRRIRTGRASQPDPGARGPGRGKPGGPSGTRPPRGPYGTLNSRRSPGYAAGDGTEEVEAWECAAGCPVAGLNAQADGASRFFPVFLYQPKAPRSQRPRLPDGTGHPTVKPRELLRWLARLSCPPGGTILDLFAGTGTTGEAAALEGARCILIERDPRYVQLAVQRLTRAADGDSGAG
jgi:DNA modification methylase